MISTEMQDLARAENPRHEEGGNRRIDTSMNGLLAQIGSVRALPVINIDGFLKLVNGEGVTVTTDEPEPKKEDTRIGIGGTWGGAIQSHSSRQFKYEIDGPTFKATLRYTREGSISRVLDQLVITHKSRPNEIHTTLYKGQVKPEQAGELMTRCEKIIYTARIQYQLEAQNKFDDMIALLADA